MPPSLPLGRGPECVSQQWLSVQAHAMASPNEPVITSAATDWFPRTHQQLLALLGQDLQRRALDRNEGAGHVFAAAKGECGAVAEVHVDVAGRHLPGASCVSGQGREGVGSLAPHRRGFSWLRLVLGQRWIHPRGHHAPYAPWPRPPDAGTAPGRTHVALCRKQLSHCPQQVVFVPRVRGLVADDAYDRHGCWLVCRSVGLGGGG